LEPTRFFQDSGRPATQAGIGRSEGILVGPDGTVYFSDYDNNQIFKVGADGVIRVAAGNGLNKFSGDGGLAIGASLALPLRLAVDANGNLYFCDARNGRIRKVTTDGVITSIAGPGTLGSLGDGDPGVLQSPAGNRTRQTG
jgi:serine/threonine-protein kinase